MEKENKINQLIETIKSTGLKYYNWHYAPCLNMLSSFVAYNEKTKELGTIDIEFITESTEVGVNVREFPIDFIEVLIETTEEMKTTCTKEDMELVKQSAKSAINEIKDALRAK